MSTHLYRAFDTWIESDIEFPWLAGTEHPVGFAPAGLTLRRRAGCEHTWPAHDNLAVIYHSRWVMPDGEPHMTVYRLSDCDVMRFHDGFSFVLRGNVIDVVMTDPSQAHLVQIQLLGPVMAYWQERRGALSLHASAVVIDGMAVAFTANSRGGKSTLAASFVQAGAALLSDDVLACRLAGAQVIGHPGFPSMRLWPSEAERFIGSCQHLDLVHPAMDKRRTNVGEGAFGRFHDAPMPVTCIYLPDRGEYQAGPPCIEITPLNRRETLVELTRLSFVARMSHAAFNLGLRMELLSGLARHVTVKRLSYPSGYEHLPAVREAVMNDARALAEKTSKQEVPA